MNLLVPSTPPSYSSALFGSSFLRTGASAAQEQKLPARSTSSFSLASFQALGRFSRHGQQQNVTRVTENLSVPRRQAAEHH